MKGTPKQPDPGRPGGRIIGVHFEEQAESVEDEAAPEAADTVHRRFGITPKKLHKYGFTAGC